MNDQQAGANEGSQQLLTLLGLAATIWKSRRSIAAIVVVAAIVSAVASLMLPEIYESSATLLVTPPPFKEVKDPQQEGIGLFPKSLGVQDYAVLLKSDAVLVEVVKRVDQRGLLTPKQRDNLLRLTVLRKALTLETSVNEKTAYHTEYSPALLLYAKGPTPEAAQALAQAWGEIAADESLSFYKKTKGGQAEYLQQQFDTIDKELKRVFAEQETNEAAYDPEEAKLWLGAMTELVSKVEDEYVQTMAQVGSLRQEVQSLQAKLADEKPKVVLFNSPPMTAVFLDKELAAKGAVKSLDGADGNTLGYQTELLNPTHVEVAQLLAKQQAALAGTEEKLKMLAQSREELRKTIDEHRGEYARHNRERKRLEKEGQVYGKNYEELANRYQQALIAEAEQLAMADVKLVANAVLPDRKIAPHRSLIVLSAVFLAFAVAVVVSIGRELLRAL